MKKITRIETAKLSIKIIENGFYEANGKRINVEKQIQKCVEQTKTIKPDDWENILIKIERKKAELAFETTTKVLNCSTIKALKTTREGLKVGVLNFASAKNPGGGFLSGASAQEESLARSSCLYASQTKDWEMYNFNRNQTTLLYSDYMIYSPEVVFWFSDDGDAFEQPFIADVITSPAPNRGAMLQHNRKDEMAEIEKVFKVRIENVLAIALQNDVESLILGAWGCGVFRNETKEVARFFNEVIEDKFKSCFQEIIYAIYDSSDKKENYNAFVNEIEK
jgi:uncharacterized protein (TIGR02452 family)